MWIGVGLTTHFALSIVVAHYTLLWIIVGAAGIGMPLYGLVNRNVRFQYIAHLEKGQCNHHITKPYMATVCVLYCVMLNVSVYVCVHLCVHEHTCHAYSLLYCLVNK